MSPTKQSIGSGPGAPTVAAKHLESWSTVQRPTVQPRRSRSRTQRRPSGSTAASSASPSNTDRGTQGKPSHRRCNHSLSDDHVATATSAGMIGVCALDVKARSKPSRNILTRLQNNGEFDVVVFGDKVILDEGESA
jgi:inositol hexakisphosphate/diphosphoinositol-pentakisphosphate kinase